MAMHAVGMFYVSIIQSISDYKNIFKKNSISLRLMSHKIMIGVNFMVALLRPDSGKL